MRFGKIIFAIFVLAAGAAFAQESPAPNIAYVYPAGARRGETVKILAGGNKFAGVNKVIIDGGGMSAKVLNVEIPFTEGGKAQLRMKLEKQFVLDNPGMKEKIAELGKDGQRFLREQTMKIPENRLQMDEADASQYLREISSDALAEVAEIELEIPPEARLGEHVLYVLSPAGISNPMRFIVGDLPEASKESLRETARKRAHTKEYFGRASSIARRKPVFVKPFNNPPIDVQIPVVVNGQITEGNTDTWRFSAKKGQRIVVSVAAQSLLPYISDAVPGWFQTVVRVRGEDGAEICYNDDFFHRPDSHAVFEAPKDGAYTVEIFDAVHRGREDFVYRMTIGSLPFAESVFPLCAPRGKPCVLRLAGANLKSREFALAPRKGGDFRLEIPGVRHLAMPMMCGEEGIDASGATPSETLKPPVFIDGIISKRGKVDVYKIELKGGEKISAEIFARRYDSPLDAYISISDAKGKILASGDDHEDLSCGLTTHHADPLVEFTPKSTGVYYLRVGDSSGGASEAHAYRLRVSAPVPDFSVCAAPTALNMRNGGAVAVKLKAFKKGGFDAPIRVFMKDLPKSWSQFGGVIPAGSDTGELVIKSPPNFKRRVSVLHAAAVSSIDGKKTYRRVSPCEDMMQAFYYRHYVPFPRFYACAGNNGSFIRPFDRMAFLPIKKPVLVVEGKPRELRLANFQSKAIWQLVPSIAESCKLSAEKFFAESGGVYVKLVPKEGAKIGDSGVFNLSVNIKNRRKIYSLDIVPNIAYKIVSQAEFDADLAAEKKAEAAAKAAKTEADKKAAIAKAAREREAAQKAAAAKAAAEKKAADKAKKDAKKKQKDAAKKQPEKKQNRDGADEKK